MSPAAMDGEDSIDKRVPADRIAYKLSSITVVFNSLDLKRWRPVEA